MFLVTVLSFALVCTTLFLITRIFITNLHGASALELIPGPPSTSFLKGHTDQLFSQRNGLDFHQQLLNRYDRVAKVGGFLGAEQLYVSDPVALQAILVKDQDVYEETTVFIENNKIIFGEGLVATIGNHHKRQRRLISPVFSLQRLRKLVPIFYNVAHRLRDAILSSERIGRRRGTLDSEEEPSPVTWKTDMAEWFSRAALESIGEAGLGYSFDPLDSSAINPYTKAVRSLIPTMFQIAPLRLLTPFVTRLGPPWFRRLLLDLVPINAVQMLKHMSDQMDRSCKEILRAKRREHASELHRDRPELTSDVDDGKDIMSILLRANEAADPKEKLSEAELLGQMNVLIFGAQDTTASALSRTIYLLSRSENIDIQTRVREEILSAYEKSGREDLDYDELMNLPLLDAVLKETLRLYPPVPFVRREARQQTVMPFSRPLLLKDGCTSIDRITVPKETTIWVSIMGANRSKDIWGEDADKWKPGRWLCSDEDSKIVSRDSAQTGKLKLPGLYSGMLTFLGGGRSCIGYRFALIEMKVMLVTLLSSFRFSATEEKIEWKLSQILSPSFAIGTTERQGMPIRIERA